MTCYCHDRKIAYPNLVRALRALTGRDHPRPSVQKDRCDYLVLEIQDLKRELGRFADRMEYGYARIEELREDAASTAEIAAVETADRLAAPCTRP